jgi:hypothetical protein
MVRMAFVEEPAAFFLRATDVFKSFDSDGDGIIFFLLILINLKCIGFLTIKETKAAVAAMCGERLSKVTMVNDATFYYYNQKNN